MSRTFNVDVMPGAAEIVHVDKQGIPLYIRSGLLSAYPDMRALCHWHEHIELIHILDGEMYYDINGKTVLLKQGDSLIVNSRHMHYGYSNEYRECQFICILFHPELLAANRFLYRNYVMSVTEHSGIEYIHIDTNHPDCELIGSCQRQIMALKSAGDDAYELEVIAQLHILWRKFYALCLPILEENTASNIDADLLLQKKMVSYIYRHFSEAITLEDIATSSHISRSKCCIIFKKYLSQSPVDFLNAYRLEVARYLIKNTTDSITDIATACGFNHLSYFSKCFLKMYGRTPREEREHDTPEPVISHPARLLPDIPTISSKPR